MTALLPHTQYINLSLPRAPRAHCPARRCLTQHPWPAPAPGNSGTKGPAGQRGWGGRGSPWLLGVWLFWGVSASHWSLSPPLGKPGRPAVSRVLGLGFWHLTKVRVEVDGGISEGSGNAEAAAAPAQGAGKELRLSSQHFNGQTSPGELSALNYLCLSGSRAGGHPAVQSWWP